MAKQRVRTLSVSEIADFAGVARSTIYDWQKLPGWPSAPDGSVALWDVAVWHATRLDPAEDGEDDESDRNSPGLERYRLARAGQEEIKLAEMKKSVLDREWAHGRIVEIAGLLRSCGEQLQREYGEDALSILEQTLNDIEQKIPEWATDDSPLPI